MSSNVEAIVALVTLLLFLTVVLTQYTARY